MWITPRAGTEVLQHRWLQTPAFHCLAVLKRVRDGGGWWRSSFASLKEGRPSAHCNRVFPGLRPPLFLSVSTVLTRPHGLHLFPRLLLFLFNQRVDFETGHCCAAPTGFIFLKPWFQMWTARPVSLSLAKAPTIMGLGVHHCFVSCCSDKIS